MDNNQTGQRPVSLILIVILILIIILIVNQIKLAAIYRWVSIKRYASGFSFGCIGVLSEDQDNNQRN